jgi:hypothetical protein
MTPRVARLAALVFLAASATAPAQVPVPRLLGIFPAGGRRGETVEVRLAGSDLEGIDALALDHPGLKAEHLQGTDFRITIGGDVPTGHHDLCAVGPLGVSNPRTFVVGDEPEGRESEPNNAPAQANPLAWNAPMNGLLGSRPDVDCFAFDGRRGQPARLELATFSIESRAEGVLRLHDPSGRPIAESRVLSEAHDPFLDLVLPADGRYVVEVRDRTYAGSPEHVYRLTLSDGPHLDAITPVVAEPGRERSFVLIGRNLGGEADPSLLLDGIARERRDVTLCIPGADRPAPAAGFLLSSSAGRRGIEYRYRRPDGRTSNPMFVAFAAAPVVVEREPDDEGHPQMVTPPCDISGAFAAPGDVDAYRFEARKGDVWWIEATAERLGSPADPMLLVQRVQPDGSLQEVSIAEDLPDPVPNFPAATASVDASLRWQASADGLYQVTIRDLYGTQRGDVRYAYRLAVRPAEPDFRLFVLPGGTVPPPAGLTLRAGGRALATALLVRLDGFEGPVLVEARDLPDGVTMDPVLIGPGKVQAPLVFSAPPGTSRQVGAVRLVGHGDEEYPVEHLAQPLAAVWPPVNNAPQTLVRAARGLPLVVVPGAPFRLTAKPAEIEVRPSSQAELTVEVERFEGFTEAIQLVLTDLPPNVPEVKGTIAKDATSATLKLTVPPNVPPGSYGLLARGTGPFPFSKDPNAKQKPKVNVTEPSNLVRVRVQK